MHRKKKRTTVNLPKKLLKRAKAEGLNLSRTLENALRRKLDGFSPTFLRQQKGGMVSPGREPNPRPHPYQATFSKKVDKKPSDFLKEFRKTCKVAWGLADSTTERHVRNAERLIDFLGGHPLTASRMDLLDFLEEYDIDDTYKAVRVIYGRFYKTDLASDIRIPQPEFKPKKIPDKELLIKTYEKLEKQDYRTAFLMLASSGLRRYELCSLTPDDVDFEKQMIIPSTRSRTKLSWVSFYNEEARRELEKLGHLPDSHKDTYTNHFHRASDGRVTPQVLRQWFVEEMRSKGVNSDYIDAFCGRVPRSIRRKHYSKSPRELREVYESAGISVLR